jgi:hypothetical protein
MNPRIRTAVIAALLLLAGVARAAGTPSSSVPPGEEKLLENPPLTVPYLDYANCPTPKAQQEAQIKAVVQYPDQDRGAVVDNGGCAVASTGAFPATVNAQYSDE